VGSSLPTRRLAGRIFKPTKLKGLWSESRSRPYRTGVPGSGLMNQKTAISVFLAERTHAKQALRSFM
jgi:hypothetical protein